MSHTSAEREKVIFKKGGNFEESETVVPPTTMIIVREKQKQSIEQTPKQLLRVQ